MSKLIHKDTQSLMDTLRLLLEWGEEYVLSTDPFSREKKPKLSNQPMAVISESDTVARQLQAQDTKLKEALSKSDARKKAEELAYNASSLDELRKALESFDGCDLKYTAIQTVFSDGTPDADVMFIGEAPGAEEDKQGKPFVGQSGQLLDKFLAWAGFSREKNVYIANTIPWRPPGNRQPTTEEAFVCFPFLERHIELVAPKLLVMLGGTSLKALHKPKDGIMTLRGKWLPYTTQNQNFSVESTPIFHPAFLLRSPGKKKLFWRDLLSLRLKAEELGAKF